MSEETPHSQHSTSVSPLPPNPLAENRLPLVALTMGDVAGVGPEVIASVLGTREVYDICRPVVVGDPVLLDKALKLNGRTLRIRVISHLDQMSANEEIDPSDCSIDCWNPSNVDTASVPAGRLDPRAGQAAYDWLVAATQAALEGRIDAIVTAPLNKAALHLAGQHYPGHTEILAEQCGVTDFAMMLYLPEGDVVNGPYGLGVAHVTLHTSIASVPNLLSTQAIQEKIHLVDHFLKRIGCLSPRIGVCALNPHAGEGGLFGNEEAELIFPAVVASQSVGIVAEGPLPADTLLQRAVSGAYDGVVAMYHDQGHIALKLIAFQRAVNVTLGLPIIRTSPSHGTAFDIAWKNKVDAGGMLSAIRVASQLVSSRKVQH